MIRKVRKVAHWAVSRTALPTLLIERSGQRDGGETSLPEVTEAERRLELISPCPGPVFGQFSFSNPVECDLTVVVPVYNTDKYVGECLDSILGQDMDCSMEIVVVNDGSTDNSLEVIEDRACRDSRVRVIDQENKGFSGARNVGIDQARGGVLCFVDSDDVLAPGHLRALWNGLEESGADYVSGTYSKLSADGRVFGRVEKCRTHGAPWSRLYRRGVWSDVRFPKGFWFEDTVIAYCIKSRFREAFVPDCGYLRRTHSASITANAGTSPKGLDSFWIVREMLQWCKALGIPLESVYAQTIRQFGPLLISRTGVLKEEQMKCMFVCCADLLKKAYGGQCQGDGLPARWALVEQSLWSRNYHMWREACKWV